MDRLYKYKGPNSGSSFLDVIFTLGERLITGLRYTYIDHTYVASGYLKSPLALLRVDPCGRRQGVQIFQVLRGVLGQLTGVVLDLVPEIKMQKRRSSDKKKVLATKETGNMGCEIQSRQGIGW
jgi:hypothetical protein